MTLQTNAFTTYSAVGNRDDLSDIIYNVAPTDCPFMTSIGQGKADAVLFEWQTDTLASASDSNFVLEGDDATIDAATATVRMSNTCNISDKIARVTGTQQAVLTAGRRDELAYQVVKVTKELRRDMETILLLNNAEVTGNATTARESAGIEAWLHTNVSRGSGGSSGASGASTDGNTAATDGTQRVFTETLLKDVLKLTFDNGGDPDSVMLGSFNKQKMSAFTGNATRNVTAEDRKLYAAIDIYESDFGDLEIITNRFQRARSALVLQKDMWEVNYLRRPGMIPLAKTGDSETRQVIAEYGLVSKNALGSGIVADLTTS